MKIIKFLKQYNEQLYKIAIPYAMLTIFLLAYSTINWWAVAVFMLLFGIIGNGVVGHRLVAHKQFNPALWVKRVLFLLCTLAAFSPVWAWRVQHLHHHKHSDDDEDLHNPDTTGFWNSFFGYTLKQNTVDVLFKTERILVTKFLHNKDNRFFLNWNYKLIWIFLISLGLISPSLLLSYFVYFWIEMGRIGTTTTFLHMKFPFNYRNFNTKDQSKNNLILGYLTFGFGWHNNHHANPSQLDNQVRWWEIDIEAKIAKLLESIPGKRSW